MEVSFKPPRVILFYGKSVSKAANLASQPKDLRNWLILAKHEKFSYIPFLALVGVTSCDHVTRMQFYDKNHLKQNKQAFVVKCSLFQ